MLLSIDCSINNNGIAVFFDHGVLLDYDLIKSTGNTEQEKIQSIVRKIDNCLGIYLISTVLIEKPPTITYNRSSKFNKVLNAKSIQKLNMVVGAIIGFVSVRYPDIEIVTADVLQWKGRQKKEVTRMNAKMLYKVETNDMNVTDAIMLGHWYISQQKMKGK